MKKFYRLNIFVAVTVFFTIFLGNFIPVHAERQRPGLTQSQIKERGRAVQQKAIMRWDSLSTEQQEHIREVTKERAGQAKMTSEEYWNSLSEEEQQNLVEGKDKVVEKSKQRWQNKPE